MTSKNNSEDPRTTTDVIANADDVIFDEGQLSPNTVSVSNSVLPLVHSDLDDYGLDPYEFRIYAHVVRRTGGKYHGECFAKLKKTAEVCKMSVRKAQYSLKTLCEAGLLLKEERKGRTDIYKLAPKSYWKPKEELEKIRQQVKNSSLGKNSEE